MRLIISPTKPENLPVGTMHLESSLLRVHGTHLFIASCKWETISITLTADIPRNVINSIKECAAQFEYFIPDGKLDSKVIAILSEMYPNLKGELYKAFMSGGDVRCVIAQSAEAKENCLQESPVTVH